MNCHDSGFWKMCGFAVGVDRTCQSDGTLTSGAPQCGMIGRCSYKGLDGNVGLSFIRYLYTLFIKLEDNANVIQVKLCRLI